MSRKKMMIEKQEVKMREISSDYIDIILFAVFLIDWFALSLPEKRVETGIYWIVIMLFMSIATRKEYNNTEE
jgi:hypothetical protein